MASTARRRLLRDMQTIKADKDEGFAAVPFEDNLMVWSAVIYGPDDTIWEGGTFKLQIQFTEEYPKQPPNVVFKTPMFHPNIYNDGKICLDILQNQWSPIYDIAAVLRSIRSLLADPNPDSPANTGAAQMYVNNKKEYARNVKDNVQLSWTV